jgi:multisubunit Na+/H+ antiporter MnhE subunit
LADFGRGIKAGVATGIVYMAISAILGAIYHNLLSIPPFIYAAQLSPFLLRDLTDFSFWASVFFPYIVRGMIFGAVFAALYNFLPGTSSVKKGVVLSLSLCIVALVEAIYTTPGWPTDGTIVSGFYALYGGVLYLSSFSLALAGFISALVFGALTGFLWDRFRAKKLVEERKGRAVLLVSFILGGVTWALLAVAFLIGVVIRGLPAINPDFWWFELLITSVVFLGLPGWVLTLVAWRKTKKGESGFKWGVAGGVMMALTGIMLFPGALAITGGVLSGRKLASESSPAATEQ